MPVQVIEAPTARLELGQLIEAISGSVTATPVRTVWPVLVTRNE